MITPISNRSEIDDESKNSDEDYPDFLGKMHSETSHSQKIDRLDVPIGSK